MPYDVPPAIVIQASVFSEQEESGFFLPQNHPVRPILDKIFASGRPTATLKTLKKAKFKTKKGPHPDNIVVAHHPKLKGYLLKLYLDSQTQCPDLYMWHKRILGSALIRSLIDSHGWNHWFKVPQKWVYALPNTISPGAQKEYIMVVEDMNLLDPVLNHARWASSDFEEERLLAFFTLLCEGGLNDSVYIDNVPFSKDGRIAFIDTEHYGSNAIHFNKLTFRLHAKKQTFWRSLFQND